MFVPRETRRPLCFPSFSFFFFSLFSRFRTRGRSVILAIIRRVQQLARCAQKITRFLFLSLSLFFFQNALIKKFLISPNCYHRSSRYRIASTVCIGISIKDIPPRTRKSRRAKKDDNPSRIFIISRRNLVLLLDEATRFPFLTRVSIRLIELLLLHTSPSHLFRVHFSMRISRYGKNIENSRDDSRKRIHIFFGGTGKMGRRR